MLKTRSKKPPAKVAQSANERHKMVRDARLERLRAAKAEVVANSFPSSEEDALELAAEVEDALNEAEADVRSEAERWRVDADGLERQAAARVEEADRLAVDPGAVEAVRARVEKLSAEVAALDVKVGNAIVAAKPAEEVERLESIRDRRHADAQAVAAEFEGLHDRAAEAEQLHSEAAKLHSQAAEFRNDAHRLETEVVARVRAEAPDIARRVRAERKRRRELELRRPPQPKPPISLTPPEFVRDPSSGLLVGPNGLVIAPDGGMFRLT